ncbi:hypothetical protein JCM10213_003091 [Rhodosporidiobolus nylandii]
MADSDHELSSEHEAAEDKQEKRDEIKSRQHAFSPVAFFNDLFSDGEDVKPIIPAELQLGGSSSNTKHKERKGNSKTKEVIDLRDESDGETPPPPSSTSQQQQPVTAQAVLTAVRSMVPDVDPFHLVKLYKDHNRNGDMVVNELLSNNYPLRGGGWKYGYSPEEKAAEQARVAQLAAAKEKKKKAKRSRSSSPDDDEEVDQLASDSEAQDESDSDDDEPARTFTKKEAMDEFAHWANADERQPGSDDYKKAALDQLYRDFNEYAEMQIRATFEKTDLYAPSWFELARLKKEQTLVKLKGRPRDMDAPIKLADGKTKARPEVPASRMLKEEVCWIAAYIEFGGKTYYKRGELQDALKTPVKPPQKTAGGNPPRRPGLKSANRAALKGVPPKKKARRAEVEGDKKSD